MSVNTIMLKVLPRLFRMLDNLARGALEGEEDSILNRYTHLSAHLTRVFVDKKADLVAGVIEKQMNDYGVDWKHAGEPRGWWKKIFSLKWGGGGKLHTNFIFHF